jgi:purine-binding chemotaxis protein CheW
MAEQKFVIFNLHGERYGLPIDRVERILDHQNPTRIPRSPKMIEGVFELRGETLAAVDLRTRLDFPAPSGHSNYIVISGDYGRAALRVDGVDGIENFDDTEIEESPTILRNDQDAFMNGVGRKGDQLTILLDVDHLIPEKIACAVSKLAKAA